MPAAGYFGGGPNSRFGDGGLRGDFDLQVLWQLDNLGFGNRARVQQRQADNRLAVLELFRLQDRVAAEVAQAYAQAQQAARRVGIAQRGVRSARASADKNLAALRETKGVGAPSSTTLLVLPSLFAVVQGWAGTRSPSLDPDDAQSAYFDHGGADAGHAAGERPGQPRPDSTRGEA